MSNVAISFSACVRPASRDLEPGVDVLCRLLAMPDRGRDGPRVGHHVPAGKYAGTPGLHVVAHDDGPILLECDAGHALQE